MKFMTHFSQEDWVDFTRGLVPPAKSNAMQAALNEGCLECASSYRLWTAVLEVTSSGRNKDPSSTAVQSAKDVYALERPWKWMLSAAMIARVLFDSFEQKALLGVRSSTRESRQITVEANPFVIDLQLQFDPSRGEIALTGQIINSENPTMAIGDADVVLLSLDNVIERTKVNSLGEFLLDFKIEPDLRLFINIAGTRAIGIVLPDLEAAKVQNAG